MYQTVSTLWTPIAMKYYPCDCDYDPVFAIEPKAWRWYDVFRTWAKLKLLRMGVVAHQVIRRVQERRSRRQRTKQKRRMYLQKLRS